MTPVGVWVAPSPPTFGQVDSRFGRQYPRLAENETHSQNRERTQITRFVVRGDKE